MTTLKLDTLSDRIKAHKNALVHIVKPPVCTERAQHYTEMYQQHLDKPIPVRRALALADAPRDKCTLSCAINGIHAAFHYLKKNYISGCVMTVPTG
ncbi:hypothetical protein LGG52_002788 [Escherichia coli]|nr:hypothetical protein [Escherichia coli]